MWNQNDKIPNALYFSFWIMQFWQVNDETTRLWNEGTFALEGWVEIKNPGPSDGLRPRSSFTVGKYKYWNDNFENYAAFGAYSKRLAPSSNDEFDYVFHKMNLSSFES